MLIQEITHVYTVYVLYINGPEWWIFVEHHRQLDPKTSLQMLKFVCTVLVEMLLDVGATALYSDNQCTNIDW